MSDEGEQTRDSVADAVTETLPPASALQGDPGHDKAMTAARGLAMLRDYALGLTYQQIADRHGYSDRSTAQKALLRYLDKHEAANARHLRTVENERYEVDQAVLRSIIMDRDAPREVRIRAIDARTRAAARHARLNGLDAPVQVAISAGVAAELDEALAELGEVVSVVVGTVVTAEDVDADEKLPPALEA